MINFNKIIKKKLINQFIVQLKKNNEIENLTFVGSFVDKNSDEKINDIDLIVITNRLNKKTFYKYIKEVSSINLKKFSSKINKIKINSTFGPLKFNYLKNEIVIHLMIYDLKGHIDHCIKSPFTVYDWERSKSYFKNKLNDLFPVGTLQLRDFFESRRGINNYLTDLKKKRVSYKKYIFYKNRHKITSKNISLVDRDKFEFYYHIIKNLLLNYIKFITKKNKLYQLKENDKKISKYFGKYFYKKHITNINNLLKLKKNSNFNLNKNFDIWIKSFVNDYSRITQKLSKNAKKIIFVRHAKTNLNDGTFLGQGRDPRLININYKYKKIKFNKIYSSPMKRSIETIKILSRNKKYICDSRLNEIDYGKAEGMDLKRLFENYPYIKKGWNNKKDLKFPGGESYKELNLRVNNFKKFLIKQKADNYCIITHNVFLRVLIGTSFNIAKEKWHRIFIPHLMKLEFYVINKKFYPNIDRNNLKTIFSNLI